MELVWLLARLTLAAIFIVAGVTKLIDRKGSREALVAFGLPEVFALPLFWFLPFAEILVALALLPLTTAWWGAIGVLGLLVVFIIGIGLNLARGNTPDCHCFGQLHSEPVSWKVFARNVVLAAIAALIVIQGKDNVGLSATEWINDMKIGEVMSLLLSGLAVALLLPVFLLLRRALKQQTELLETVIAMKKVIDEDYAELAPVERPVQREDAAPPVEGLPVGAPAPAFSLATLGGGQMSLENLLVLGNPLLLLFVSPTCSPCKTLLPHLRTWQRNYGDFLTIALLSKGTETEVQGKLAKYEARHVLLQGESSIADEYQAKWTPAAVLVDCEGKIASPVTYGEEAIKALVTHTVTTAEVARQNGAQANYRPQIKVGKSLFKVGEPAPRFALSAVDGTEVNLDSLLGQDTLLLFWNPGCGFCKAMADDLMRWEAKPSTTQLVFISSGEAAEVQKESERFRSPVLYDPDFDLASMLGANGTPSAVLLDVTGRIASSLAVGEQNILALLGVRKVTLPVAKAIANGAAAPTTTGSALEIGIG